MHIALDCEAGGLDNSKSLLSVYAVHLDKDLKTIEDIHLKIKPDNEVYIVTAKALEVNGIDLVKHDQEAIKESEASNLLGEFIKNAYVKNDKKRLIPIGHNVKFDLDFIEEKLFKQFYAFVGKNPLDTMYIAKFLAENNFFALQNKICSLSGLVKSLNIKVDGKEHDPKYDTWCSIEIYKLFSKMLNNVNARNQMD